VRQNMRRRPRSSVSHVSLFPSTPWNITRFPALLSRFNRRMENFDALSSFIVLAGVLVNAAIFFGPSLCSSYENWKIRQGFKGENPMSKITEIKEAMDTKLDQLEDRATVAQTLLQQTKGQALEQYETLKKGLSDTLEGFE